LNKGRDVTPSAQGSQALNDFGEGEPVSSSDDFYDNQSSFEPEPPAFEEPRFELAARTSAHVQFENKSSEHETKLHPAPPLSAQAAPHQPPLPAAATPEVRIDVPAPPVTPVSAATTVVPPQLHLQLDEVLFPSQPEELFRIRITSTDTPKQTQIWIENIQSREERYVRSHLLCLPSGIV
jgi:hypothetical protein